MYYRICITTISEAQYLESKYLCRSNSNSEDLNIITDEYKIYKTDHKQMKHIVYYILRQGKGWFSKCQKLKDDEMCKRWMLLIKMARNASWYVKVRKASDELPLSLHYLNYCITQENDVSYCLIREFDVSRQTEKFATAKKLQLQQIFVLKICLSSGHAKYIFLLLFGRQLHQELVHLCDTR